MRRESAGQLDRAQAAVKESGLAREAEVTLFLYKQALTMGNETEVSAANQANNIRIVDHAKVPMEHSSPRTILVLFMATSLAVLSTLLGLVLLWISWRAGNASTDGSPPPLLTHLT